MTSQAAGWFHPLTRRIVVIDKDGVVYRVLAAGPIEPRAPKPLFELKKLDGGVLEIGVWTKKRRLRLELTDVSPERPEWIEVTAEQLAGMVLKLQPKPGGVAQLARGALRAFAELGSAWRQIHSALAYLRQ